MSYPPSDAEFGNDCNLCFPAGKTPQWFLVAMNGVKRGDLWAPHHGQPPNGVHVITQQAINPCWWYAVHPPTGFLSYTLHAAFSRFVFEAVAGVECFRREMALPCKKHFQNWFTVPAGNRFWGGSVYVTPIWELQDYWEGVTPIVDPDPQLMVFSRDDGKIVIQYTDQWGDTNCSMLVDPEA